MTVRARPVAVSITALALMAGALYALSGSYNAVVGVGDITDDGRSDLVSRDTSGNLYRNNGYGKGSFGGRVKIASGWKGYKSLS